VLVSFGAVSLVTFIAYRLVSVNATTVGFAYLLLVLVIASAWGFPEAALASLFSTLLFNFFFFPPVGRFTIADPQNWVALSSFLATSLIASRLSTMARRRTVEALERQRDLEHLYAFSRAILLIDRTEPFPQKLVSNLAEIFGLSQAAFYDQRNGQLYRTGVGEADDFEHNLRDGVLQNARSSSNRDQQSVILPVRLGSQVLGNLALWHPHIAPSVLDGIASLVAVGLERARAQELAEQIEAARQSEQLRTTLIDAMAHEFKTPLTLIKGATSSLLASPDGPFETRREQLAIADEEAEHLRKLIDDAIEMARLDTAHIDVHLTKIEMRAVLEEVLAAMRSEISDRRVEVLCDEQLPAISLDRRLIGIAIKQLLDNALKYSLPDTPICVEAHKRGTTLTVTVKNQGDGIPIQEQPRVFERFYRGSSAKHQIPGSGLGLSIADSIVRAHRGKVTLTSRPGETNFEINLPVNYTGVST
jgi:two-component system sensor histidine kinase KdpD